MTWIPRFRQENLTLQYLEENISYFEPGTTNLKGINIFLFDHRLYALLNQIENFPKTLRISEKEIVTRLAIIKIRDTDPITIIDFKKSLQDEVSLILNEPRNKFFLLIPTKIKSQDFDGREIHAINSIIKFVKIDFLDQNFSFNASALTAIHVDNNEITEFLNPDYYYLLIEQYGRNAGNASHESFKKFEQFRAILNFVADWQSYSFHFGMAPKTKSYFISPDTLFLFDDKKKEFHKLGNDLQQKSKEYTSRSALRELSDKISKSEEIINKIEKIEDQHLKNLILSSFELHTDALDNYGQKWICCFHLWQIIELISLCGVSGSYDQISKRIITLLGESHPWNDTIQSFLQKRNNFVHRGNKDEFTYLDINAVKGIVQFSMMRLLDKTNEIKNFSDLKFFYDCVDYFYKCTDITDDTFGRTLNRKNEIFKIVENMVSSTK
jgi:hypothetical protein